MRAFFNPEKSIQRSNYSIQELSNIIIQNKLDSREVLPENTFSKKYAKNLQDYEQHQTKFILEKDMNDFQADYLIVDDVFYFIAFSDEIVAIEIHNDIFVKAQQIIFDQLWEKL